MPVSTTAPVEELVRRGRITDALTSLESHPEPGVETLCLLLECHLARGEMRRAVATGERLSGTPHRAEDDDRRAAFATARLSAATGHDEHAVTLLRQLAELSVAEDDAVAYPWRGEAAVSLVRLGRRAEAEDLAEEQLGLARVTGSAYATAAAIRTAAAVCVATDRREQLREAHALVAGTFERLAAQVATDLAGLLALHSHDPRTRSEAVSLLRGAEAYADTEDLWPLHARVRRLLERLGETALLPRSEALARLSDAELRIARLAAAGETNRSIAGALEITTKAVEWHLSNTYRKLDIAGRAELPALLRIS